MTEKTAEDRRSRNIGDPVVDFNRCSLDELDATPVLTREIKEKIIHLRGVHRVGIRDWHAVKDIKGLGDKMLEQLMLFCKDPYTTPLGDQENEEPAKAKPPSPAKTTDVCDLVDSDSSPPLVSDTDSAETRQVELVDALNVVAPKPKPVTNKPHNVGVVLVADRTVMDLKIKDKANKWNETFLAAGKKEKPGLSMFDSGCFRCIGGHATHEEWERYLAMYGLKPIIVDRVEEFVFGNCETELSDKAFMYPVFNKGKIIDVIDIARIKPECPSSISKKLMKI